MDVATERHHGKILEVSHDVVTAALNARAAGQMPKKKIEPEEKEGRVYL